MRRKCRLTDIWLTRRVLLDSWNVTLSQGAERCTLHMSLSNNRSRFICLLRLNAEMTGLLRRQNTSDTLPAQPTARQRSKLLVPIKKYKCSCFPFHANTNAWNPHEPWHIVTRAHWWLRLHQQHRAQNEVREERVFYISVGKTVPRKGFSTPMVC